MVSEGNASSFGLFIEKGEILSLELVPQSQEQLVTIVRHLGGISDIVQARVIVVHIRHKWIEVSVSGGILVSQVYREVLAWISRSKRETIGGLPVGIVRGSGIGHAW